MSNSSTLDDRTNTNLATATLTKQKTTAPSPRWSPASSLRPDPEALALGCMDGDEEAMAVVEAWRFRTSRATRLVVRHPEDLVLQMMSTIVVEGHGVAPVTIAKLQLSKEETPAPSRANEESANSLSSGLWQISPAWKQTFGTGLSWQQREKAVEELLDKAMTAYDKDQEAGWDELWEALHLLGAYRSQAYQQKTLRDLEWGQDLTHDFVAHVWGQIRKGKYNGTGKFSHWAKKCYRKLCRHTAYEADQRTEADRWDCAWCDLRR